MNKYSILLMSLSCKTDAVRECDWMKRLTKTPNICRPNIQL